MIFYYFFKNNFSELFSLIRQVLVEYFFVNCQFFIWYEYIFIYMLLGEVVYSIIIVNKYIVSISNYQGNGNQIYIVIYYYLLLYL